MNDEIVNRVEFYRTGSNMKAGEGYKDLHKITFDFFRSLGHYKRGVLVHYHWNWNRSINARFYTNRFF